MKCYFLLFLLYSKIYADEKDNYGDDCHYEPHVNSAEECFSRVTEHLKKYNAKCCYFEGTKEDGSQFKECRFLDPGNTLDELLDTEKTYFNNNVVYSTCGADSETESHSRSDSNYLYLGILSLSLSLLFLI